MLKNYVKHYRVADVEERGTWTRLDEFAGAFPAHQFSAYLRYQSERRVNWPVTFARRGLNWTHYYESSSTDTSCTFTVAKQFKSLGPRLAIFALQSADPEAPLQGDTLTYLEQSAGLYLERFDRVENCLSMKFVRKEIYDRKGVFYLTGELPAHMPRNVNRKAYEHWHTRVRDIWSDERSVLAVCIE